MAKLKEREKAIELRRRGLSYSEIQLIVSVSKAILSSWLYDIPLTGKQQDRLRKKILAGHKVAWKTIHTRQVKKTAFIKETAAQEIGEMSKRELWLIGIALYWAEGSKAKEHNVSQGVVFSNSDWMMIKLFLYWLQKCVIIDVDRIRPSLYLHNTAKNRLEMIQKYWENVIGKSAKNMPVYFKKGTSQSYRKNRSGNYYGVMRITIKSSSELNRRISGWIEGICRHI